MDDTGGKISQEGFLDIEEVNACMPTEKFFIT